MRCNSGSMKHSIKTSHKTKHNCWFNDGNLASLMENRSLQRHGGSPPERKAVFTCWISSMLPRRRRSECDKKMQIFQNQVWHRVTKKNPYNNILIILQPKLINNWTAVWTLRLSFFSVRWQMLHFDSPEVLPPANTQTNSGPGRAKTDGAGWHC